MSDCPNCDKGLRDIYRDQNPKHPVRYNRDCGERLVLGDLVEMLADLIDADAIKAACDCIDESFLFGAWGSETRDRQPLFLRDLRGLIVAAYEEGKRR